MSKIGSAITWAKFRTEPPQKVICNPAAAPERYHHRSGAVISMRDALKRHWPEYLMEAAELGLFMICMSVFAILLYHPASPVVRFIPSEFSRRILMGLAMGLTLIVIVFSPWGKQSGAHMNPAFTLTFYRMGKVAPWDALFYIIAQFVGGVIGVGILAVFAGKLLDHPAVNYVSTVPGPEGAEIAFFAETLISFILAAVVLTVSNTQKIARFTGMFVGACVAAFIIVESPLSGTSMNPARTLGSAVLPGIWTALWIYFLAPPLGMLAAAAGYNSLKRPAACAKLHHENGKRCIFCEYQNSKLARHRITAVATAELSET
jgi:aquaporin Z